MANFNTYWAKSTARDRIKPLHFTPSDGTHYFWFRNRPLAFIRYSEDNQGMGHGGLRALERPSITYIGRNPAILKDLLLEAQHSYVAKDANNTVIYRFRSDMGSAHWFFSMARPLRPLSTVILDLDHKERLITNIKEYLHPGTRRWYRIAGFRIDGNTSFMGHLEQGRQVCALL
ncbi:BCS1 N terminal-domain-containing protein [Aspergillus pseudoustus]|uniref:BCS1 N terminal-domain-containing protein n=1 Tax=Aspergillus pseudoustus TaxID=1810923 RepID=A0ABR4JQ23_9EURO